MSLFPRFPQTEFAPIFRLLDDYDSHRSARSAASHIRAFQPKFDVRELKDAYELHGELPGIDQKDMDIEFTDPHTLVVKGRVERTYEEGTKPEQGRITGEVSNEQQKAAHKATVEDASEDKKQDGAVAQAGKGQVEKHQGEKEEATYWVSERSVGEFHRSFSFPSRVDQDNVKAKLNNGVLTITVPKAAAPKAKKINIG